MINRHFRSDRQRFSHLAYLFLSRRFLSNSEIDNKGSQTACKKCKRTFDTYMNSINRPLVKSNEKQELMKCIEIRSPSFEGNRAINCLIHNKMNKIILGLLRSCKDVIAVTDNPDRPPRIFLGILNVNRKEGHADLTGDHGEILTPFLKEATKALKIESSSIKALIDVGGQDCSLVELVQNTLEIKNLKSLIVDINPMAPLVSPEKKEISYIISDARDVFSNSGKYFKIMDEFLPSGPRLFVLNNLINVLGREQSHSLLVDVWNRMRSRDLLAIGGLSEDQFKDITHFDLLDNKNGIIDVKHSGKFFKSALTSSFVEEIKKTFNVSENCIFSADRSIDLSAPVESKQMKMKLVLITKP